jgi:hypothetical protein
VLAIEGFRQAELQLLHRPFCFGAALQIRDRFLAGITRTP